MENQEENSYWGIASLITALISVFLVLMPYFGLPLAIFSLVASHKQNKLIGTGSGLALAGKIIGIIGIVINFITLFFLGIGLLFFAGFTAM